MTPIILQSTEFTPVSKLFPVIMRELLSFVISIEEIFGLEASKASNSHSDL